ncbi:MAG: radical SAM family heme chaperone HemW [Bacteroidota bacterium]|nr:radical SAM family heme chaperone HemW [Bacteroidota bacterium]
MAGIYIHIPFCRLACHYCNFHFTTSIKFKNELIAALLSEIELRRSYLENEIIETIYIGGGTPSLIEIKDLRIQIEKIKSIFVVNAQVEITLEANPDDINEEKLQGWKHIGINRLSIGIQSFFQEDLQWMNRAHNACQAHESIELSLKHGFDNITIDLIYGAPLLSDAKWQKNVETAISYNIPHLSCYALTVEPKTPLFKLIRENKTDDVNPDQQANQFLLLMDWLNDAGYEHYEISNFAKAGYRSKHNSSYWQRKKYLGLGPSAHSFNGSSRQWTVSNNNIYIESLSNGIIPFEKEELTPTQQINEYIMTSLRTIEGIDLNYVANTWDVAMSNELEVVSKNFIESKLLRRENNVIKLTRKGKLLADGIAAELFFG